MKKIYFLLACCMLILSSCNSKQTDTKNNTDTNHTDSTTEAAARPKACILYFHGGGLLYGNRNDLPEKHLKTLTEAGYAIAAFDYPLAPAAKLDLIMEDVCASINHYIENSIAYVESKLPYFLWGRSAGAYLCLIVKTDTNTIYLVI